MIDANVLDLATAPEFRKKATVLAFHRPAGATYDKIAAWGSNQELPGPHYMIVGTLDWQPQLTGNHILSGDVYGCAEDEFRSMYEPTDRKDEYRKTESVRALQLNEPFIVNTTTRDGNVEVQGAKGEPGDWVALQPRGERQLIRAAQFGQLYEPVEIRE